MGQWIVMTEQSPTNFQDVKILRGAHFSLNTFASPT